MKYDTSELCDIYQEDVNVVEPLFSNFGGRSSFGGQIITVKCFEDNGLLYDLLEQNGRGRVLLVDDSQVALQQTLNVLRQLGFDCTAVRSAQAALQQLHEYHQAGMPFELLVSDIEMPELDGYSLVQEIRRSPDIAGTYVLLHTSLDSTMNTEKARSVGANAVLTKFSSVDLTQALLDAFRQMSGQA